MSPIVVIGCTAALCSAIVAPNTGWWIGLLIGTFLTDLFLPDR